MSTDFLYCTLKVMTRPLDTKHKKAACKGYKNQCQLTVLIGIHSFLSCFIILHMQSLEAVFLREIKKDL